MRANENGTPLTRIPSPTAATSSSGQADGDNYTVPAAGGHKAHSENATDTEVAGAYEIHTHFCEREAAMARTLAVLEADVRAQEALPELAPDDYPDETPDDYALWIGECFNLTPVLGYAPDLRGFCGQWAPSDYLILLDHRKLFTDDTTGEQVLTAELYGLNPDYPGLTEIEQKRRRKHALELTHTLGDLPVKTEVIQPGTRGDDSTLLIFRRDPSKPSLPPEYEVPEQDWQADRIAALGRRVDRVRATASSLPLVEPLNLSRLRGLERWVLAGRGEHKMLEPLEPEFDRPGKYTDSAHFEAHDFAAERGRQERLRRAAELLLGYAAAGQITVPDVVHVVRTLARLSGLHDASVPNLLDSAWTTTYNEIARAAA